MKKFALPIFLLLFAPAAFAQSTTTSGTFSDSASQALAYGSWTLKFSPSPSSPSGPYSWNGSPFNIQTSYTGALDSSGAMTGFSIQSTNFINPTGNSWQLTVCPAATTNCSSGNVVITGSTQDLSTAIVIPAIQVQANASTVASAYTDAEIAGAIPGYVYYNITSTALRLCVGPLPCTWTAVGSGGGGTVTDVTGTSPIVSSGGTTPDISCPTCIKGTTSASHLAYSTGADTLSDIAGSSANAAGDVTLAPTTGAALAITAASGADGIEASFATAPAGPFTAGIGANLTAGGNAFFAQIMQTNGTANLVGYTGSITETDSAGSGVEVMGISVDAGDFGTNVAGEKLFGGQFIADDGSTGGAAAEVSALRLEAACQVATVLCSTIHILPSGGPVGISPIGIQIDAQSPTAASYTAINIASLSGHNAIVTTATDPSTLGLLTVSKLFQNATKNFAGTCPMSTSTTCTFTLTAAFTGTPICIVTAQGSSIVGGAAACGVSGTTVTITAAVANSNTWGAVLIGNPN